MRQHRVDDASNHTQMLSNSVTEVMRALYQSLDELSTANVLLVTSGERWHYRQPEFPRGVTVLHVDCRHFHDPNSDRDLRGHLGRHRDIMTGLANRSVMSELVEEVKEFLRKHPGQKLVVHFFCTSGRHRSVGIATMIFYYIETARNRAPMLLHFHLREWESMTCGGRCDQCGGADPNVLPSLVRSYVPDTRRPSEPVRSDAAAPVLMPAQSACTVPVSAHTVPVPRRSGVPTPTERHLDPPPPPPARRELRHRKIHHVPDCPPRPEISDRDATGHGLTTQVLPTRSMSCLDWFARLKGDAEERPGDAGGTHEVIPGDLEGPEASVDIRQVPVDTDGVNCLCHLHDLHQFQHLERHLCRGPHTVRLILIFDHVFKLAYAGCCCLLAACLLLLASLLLLKTRGPYIPISSYIIPLTI